MTEMRKIRRKDKSVTDENEKKKVLKRAKYFTVDMSHYNEPYLATLSHGYDEIRNCIYFHSVREGKKIDILNENNLFWGQARAHTLQLMIRQLKNNPDKIIAKQVTPEFLQRVHIGRIDIEYMSGKKAEKVIIST